ncbi:hypothetical protein Acy02nite_24490 [Actinoplanes cyaneus]|uniref:Uncharacterized protein n=1 Tax=Actinoplanes cyaneus TaxID=52696 RepID=A0A919M4U3_9ACTN|nr:hypothetical protein [Actinoplanes cyaneus]MCW2136287.1 hypothetical protein [Actinoplanes cyaneus]GID64568.1 hypothetical protein Acy02nite_24490 [Actinoplanes cyaneus]
MTFPPDDPWGTPAPAPGVPTPSPAGIPPVPPQVPPVPPVTSQVPPVPSQVPGGPPPVASGPVIVRIAEIEITSSTIRTPVGDFPLAGSRWQVNEFWVTQRRTPLWAKIAGFGLAVCTFGLSLLLLLIKESPPQGTVTVTLTSGPQQYVARIPVDHEDDVVTINQQVNYVRSLAAL